MTTADAPTVHILKHFEKRVSAVLSIGKEEPAIYSIPRKSSRYKRELVTADRLLAMADYDISLVTDCIDQLFNNPKFSWRTWESLMQAEGTFVMALAIVQADRASAVRIAKREQLVLSQINQTEDIFA